MKCFGDRNSCIYINYYTGENTKINYVNIDQDCVSKFYKKTSQIVINQYRHRIAWEVVGCKIIMMIIFIIYKAQYPNKLKALYKYESVTDSTKTFMLLFR